MKLETRRQRAARLKKQKKSAIIGMAIAAAVVLALAIVLWNGKKNLSAKNAEYESTMSELQTQIEAEKERTTELNERKKYVQTKKYVEEIAKNKFGLIYPDEIVFKAKNK